MFPRPVDKLPSSYALSVAHYPQFSYLNQFGASIPFSLKDIPFHGKFYSSGDKLYRETSINLSAKYELLPQFGWIIQAGYYQVRVQSYGSAGAWTLGVSSYFHLRDDTVFSVEYDNLLIDRSSPLSEDIPRRGVITLESHIPDRHTFRYQLERDPLFPVSHRLSWQFKIRPEITLLAGFSSYPASFLVGGKLKYNGYCLWTSVLIHPLFGSVVGINLERLR